MSYGVAFGSGGWRSVAAAGQASREAYALPDGIALWLSVEGQTVALDDAAARRRRCGCIRGRNHGVQRSAVAGAVPVAIAGARLLRI